MCCIAKSEYETNTSCLVQETDLSHYSLLSVLTCLVEFLNQTNLSFESDLVSDFLYTVHQSE